MARKQPIPDIKILYGRAASRCCFPKCRRDLVVESKKDGRRRQIGKIAHIVAHSDSGPRADSSYPKEKRDTYENWILLCGTHHDLIDALDSDYTVTDLREMKRRHETWVRDSLEKETINIGFAELEVAAKAMLSATAKEPDSSFHALPPEEKIAKNNLTESTRELIAMGLARSSEVGKYIENQSKLDDNFPERLKEGFRSQYNRLVEGGTNGDALFEGMLEFSSGYSSDFKRQSAGLAILTHLFELCEVFEK